MKTYPPRPDEIRDAQFVLGMSEITHPAYPDPSTESGWADVPAVLLLLDLAGREDIVYHAMMQASTLAAEGGALQTTEPDGSGRCVYLLTADFGHGIDWLRIAGIATEEAIEMFSRAEILLLSDDARTTDDDTAPILAIMPNDPIRWSYLLPGDGPDASVPTGDSPASPNDEYPAWNAHRRAWLVRDPQSCVWFEYRVDGWHALDGLSDAS